MSERKSLLASLLVPAAIALSLPPAGAAAFSADFVTTGPRGSATGTVYVSGRNVREEKTVGARRTVTIINWDRKTVWYLNPQEKTYWGQTGATQMLADRLDALKGKTPAGAAAEAKRLGLKVTRLGTEKVSGYQCEKTVTEGKGLKTTIWFSKSLDWPLKTETIVSSGPKPTTIRTEYRNVKLRRPPASLFQAPKGYRRVPPPFPRAGAPGAERADDRGRFPRGDRGPRRPSSRRGA